MTLQEKIRADFMTAFKARNTDVVETLRLLSSDLHNRGIEKKGKGGDEALTDEETLEIIRREAKRRKEAIVLYTQGNRADLVAQEEKELKVLETYLPTLMGEDEIRVVVEKVVADYGAIDAKDFGKVMGVAMKELKGKADAALVTKILKEKIS
ncbi:MAG: GatB/YqeY domain-containing protein [Candidatus Jorgensenbacteria bacterium]|nr:GatB/YqeY domain-containing protein [Candidatus Jorgensenbacteria bacterium]